MRGTAEVGVHMFMSTSSGDERVWRKARLKVLIGNIKHNLFSVTSLADSGWRFTQGPRVSTFTMISWDWTDWTNETWTDEDQWWHSEQYGWMVGMIGVLSPCRSHGMQTLGKRQTGMKRVGMKQTGMKHKRNSKRQTEQATFHCGAL